MSFRVLTNVALRAARPVTLPVTLKTVARPAISFPVLQSVRTYAKKKDNKKDSKKAQSHQSEQEKETVKEALFDEDQFQSRYEQCIQSLKEHLSNIRVGRAAPSLLDSVKVRIENTNFPLKDLAQVTVRDPQTLMVISHDEDYVSSIDKAIRDAGLNLNPMIESKGIRVPIPKATKETRDKMAKIVTSTGEQAKTKIRAIRQDGMKLLKEDKKHQSADDIRKLEKSVQNMTDKFNKTVDDLLKTKVKEIQLIREKRMTPWLLKWATGLVTLGIFLFLTICRLEINAHVFFKDWIPPLDQPVIEPLSRCFENLQGNKTFTVNIVPGLPVWEDNTCFDFAQLFQSSKHPFEGSQVFHTFWSSYLTSYFDEKPMATLRSFAATQNLNYTLTVWISAEDEEGLIESEGWRLAEKTQRIRYQIIQPDTLVRGTALEPYVKEIWRKTNLLRMLVLYQYGGVWFDLDTMFIRDMSPLFEHEWIAQGGCRSDPFTGALFHFHRQSPFVCEILEGASDLFRKNESGEDPEIFGSKLYYRVYKRLLHHQIRPWSALSWCFTDPSRCGHNSLPSMFVNIDLDKEKIGKAFAYHWRGRWNYMPGSIFKYLESMNKKKISW